MISNDYGQFEYDVALSFAGEDRATVEKFARLLKEKNIKYFYDESQTSELWGKDLISHLSDVYENRARYCVMFISKHYPLKLWTNFERSHIQARAFRDTNEYILPIRLDDTQVPGLAETVGYRDVRQQPLESIAEALEQKILKAKNQANFTLGAGSSSAPAPSSVPTFDSIPMPKRKKSFTQLQKDRFSRETFDLIRKYFQQALKQLESHDIDIQTDFAEITAIEFTCKIYVHETAKCQCQIWLGDTLTPNSIHYNEGRQTSGHNSVNDYLPVEDNGEDLLLRIGAFGITAIHIKESLATPQQAAEYLWRRFTAPLEYR